MKIRSMTGFASAERELENYQFSWEIRSVNHRYLDLSIRIPESFRYLESELRTRINSLIKRGRLDITLSAKKTGVNDGEMGLDLDLVRRLLKTTQDIESLAPTPLTKATALEFMRWPGVLQERELDRENVGRQLIGLLDEAINKLVTARETEGAQLAELIRQRCQAMQAHVSKVRSRVPAAIGAIKQKLQVRLNELSADPDLGRLEQEMIYLAQKMDVAEELDRLDSHLGEVLRTLKQAEPSGRRLDFIVQEMNREANTLASKSADQETTMASVEMKVLIEQMREQIQNIE